MIINGSTLVSVSPIRNMLTKKEKAHGTSYGLSELGYDIRIKQRIEFCPLGPTAARFTPEGVKEQTAFGRFILASAMEEFTMPETLGGIVHDKSTWARRGLSVFNTVIEPGWHGFLTLELVYHGSENLVIPAGAGIAQVIFHQTFHRARYKGKYQDQVDRPVAAIES